MNKYEKMIVEETTERFDRVVNLIISESKTPRDYGSGEVLHFAEIHAINFIGVYKNISITDWYQDQIKFLKQHNYFTPTAQHLKNSQKSKNIRSLEYQLIKFKV